MKTVQKIAAIGVATIALACSLPAAAQPSKPAPIQSKISAKQAHRIVVQITQNDPGVMNMALNNAENLTNYYTQKGEKVDIEFVAYGPGLHMVRSDTSPVKDRLASLAGKMKNVVFSGCGNTMGAQSRQENKDITLVPEARVVQTGIARILELQEQGWAYVRP
jgi:intracellular sulfur oxidation DsrE/DsrF family protein